MASLSSRPFDFADDCEQRRVGCRAEVLIVVDGRVAHLESEPRGEGQTQGSENRHQPESKTMWGKGSVRKTGGIQQTESLVDLPLFETRGHFRFLRFRQQPGVHLLKRLVIARERDELTLVVRGGVD